MTGRRKFLMTMIGAGALMALPKAVRADIVTFNVLKKKRASFPYQLTDNQWLSRLGQQGYLIMREGEDETPGTAPLLRERRRGMYACAGCKQPLFSSSAKVMANDWPTFRQPASPKILGTSADFGIILPRTEVHCANCGGHLGYKFTVDDNAAETWRYSVNGAALDFQPKAI